MWKLTSGRIVMFCVQFEASDTPGKGAVGVRYSEINNLFMPSVLHFCRSLCTMLEFHQRQ